MRFWESKSQEARFTLLPGMADADEGKWHLLSIDDSHQSVKDRLVQGEDLPEGLLSLGEL